MRAKTKKNLILQLVVIAIILPLVIWWHPVGPNRVIIKWGAIALAGFMYAILDRLWKWKDADEDEKPLWFENKSNNNEDAEQPEESDNNIETAQQEELQPSNMRNVTESSTSNVDNKEEKDRTNFGLVVLISALALLMILAVILVMNRKPNKTENTGYNTYAQSLYDSNEYNSLNETEQKILGKWDSSWSEDYYIDEDEREYPWLSEVAITQVSTDEFKSDKTEIEEINIKYKYTLDFDNSNYYYYAVLEYTVHYEGVWYADGNNLFLKGTDSQHQLLHSSFIGDVGDLDEDYYLELLKDMHERAFIEYRKESYKQSEQKILNLSDTELKVELEDGDVLTETKIY